MKITKRQLRKTVRQVVNEGLDYTNDSNFYSEASYNMGTAISYLRQIQEWARESGRPYDSELDSVMASLDAVRQRYRKTAIGHNNDPGARSRSF